MLRHRYIRIRQVGPRYVLVLAALVLLGLGGFTLFRGLVPGIPLWVILAGIIPLVVALHGGFHPLIALLHPVLPLLLTLGGTMLGVLKHRSRHRER
jgi:hypothetical protein